MHFIGVPRRANEFQRKIRVTKFPLMYLASVLSTVIICHLPVSRRECGPSSVGLIVEFVP